jgi:hypothetical protein
MRLRNDVRGYNFSDSLPCGRPGINSAADRGDVTAHDRSDQARVDLFPTNEPNVRGFHHRISRLDHRHQSTAFNHS